MADAKLSALGTGTPTDADHVYINDGGTSAKVTLAALRTFIVGKGKLSLDLMSLREIASDEIPNEASVHGGILTSDSTPSLKRVSTSTDKALKVEWVGGNVDEVQFPPVFMPPDFNSSIDATVHLLAKMDAGGDTPTIDIQVFDGIGDTEMGGATAALSSSLAELSVTLANANLSGHPLGFLNISLVPGTHATQLVELYAAWIEYTRKAS